MKEGEKLWPPPAPAQPATPPPKKEPVKASVVQKAPPNPFKSTLNTSLGITAGLSSLLALGVAQPSASFAKMMTTFSLAGFCGYKVVWSVTPSLHSPLMSVTNAISGMTAAGGLALMGGGLFPNNSTTALAAASVFMSTINIFGGFLITQRMLDMFRRPGDPPEYNYLYGIPALALLGGYAGARYMGVSDLHQMAYLASSLCCISSIGGLSAQDTCRLGNAIGMVGVSTGIVATIDAMNFSPEVLTQAAYCMGLGAAIGTVIAKRIAVTDLPQLVALFHSLVGLAAVLTSVGFYIQDYTHFATDPAAGLHQVCDDVIGIVQCVTINKYIRAY